MLVTIDCKRCADRRRAQLDGQTRRASGKDVRRCSRHGKYDGDRRSDGVGQTKTAINKIHDTLGVGLTLECALDIDIQIEAMGSIDKRQFMEAA